MAFGFSRQSLLSTLGSLAIIGAAAITQGCIITTTDSTPAPVPTGTLVVTWDIQGSTAAASCNAHTAATFQIRVYDRNGQVVGGNYQQACTAFATTIPVGLSPGDYTVQAELLDAANRLRTTTVGAAPALPVKVTIYSRQETDLPVTFPDTSFL